MSKDVPGNPTPTPEKFAQTEEAQEYLDKLQAGKTQLPDEANALEKEAYENLRGLNGKLRSLSTNQADVDKQIVQLKNQREGIGREIDMATGQATAFASMLVSAEGGRREAKAAELAAEQAEAEAEDSEAVEQAAIAEVKAELAADRAEAGDDASLVSVAESVELETPEQPQPQPQPSA